MGYKFLGFVVWNAGRLYLKRRYGKLFTRRRALLAGGVAAAAGGAAAFALKSRSE